MTTAETQVLKFIKEKLATRFQIERVVLFGSRARGSANHDSDFDVLVIAESQIPFVQRQGLALQALGKRDFSVDLLMYTPAEERIYKDHLGSAIYWANLEGQDFNG